MQDAISPSPHCLPTVDGSFWLQQGNQFLVQGAWCEATACYQQALLDRPDLASAWTNLGSIFQEQRDEERAIACHLESVRIDPDFADGLYNLGNAYKELGKAAQALPCYERLLALRPDFASAHLNYSLALLTLGFLDSAWPHYEYRFACGNPPPRLFPQPQWYGDRQPGKTLLVHAEQGFGDILMFARYLPLIRKQSEMRVLFECPARLVRLLSQLDGVDAFVAQDSPLPDFDLHVPLLSLPLAFRTDISSIPSPDGYLHPDSELLSLWESKLSPQSGLRVGIAWQGDAKYRFDQQRSIPLRTFISLASVPGVHLFSLQKGPGSDQLSAPNLGFSVDDFGGQLDQGPDAFLDTAAVMKQLDLVVTADTSIAHLAGALGVKTWVALPSNPHWAWMGHGKTSPWYENVQVFRQARCGQWTTVFEAMAAELSELAALKVSPRTTQNHPN